MKRSGAAQAVVGEAVDGRAVERLMIGVGPVVCVAIEVEPPTVEFCLLDYAMRTRSQLRCTLATVRSCGPAGLAHFWYGGAVHGDPPQGLATDADPLCRSTPSASCSAAWLDPLGDSIRACSRGHHEIGVSANA
jgi:hypothetical protein